MTVTRTQAARALGVGLLLAVAYGIYEQMMWMQAGDAMVELLRAIAAASPDEFTGLDLSDEAVSMTALDWLPIIGSFAVELGAAAWLLTYKPAPTFAQPVYGVPPMPYMQPAPQWSAPPNSQFGEPR